MYSNSTCSAVASRAPVEQAFALARIDDFAAFVAAETDDEARWSDFLRAEQAGRPVGANPWIGDLEKQYGRTLSPAKRGPKTRPGPSPE